MKTFCSWIAFLLVMGTVSAGFAEFYKYIDEDGKVQFTDNIANVPPDQRERLEAYEEVTPSKTRQPGQTPEMEAVTGEEGERSTAVVDDEELIDDRAEALEKRGAALEKEYEALMEEREGLDKAAKVRLTPAKKRELVERISDFNLRIKAYEKKRQAYNAEVEAYNAGVVETESEQPPALSPGE
jgi:hypothetical protein